MSCVVAKTKLINIDSTVRIIYVGIRSGLDCNCAIPGVGLSAVTLRIRRKGISNGSLLTYPAYNRDAMGNIGFYLDNLLYSSPKGLYTATVYRGITPCMPSVTMRIGKPCNVDGAYTIRSTGLLGDENPSP